MPDLRELRVFVAVAEQLSFTRAAEQLHFTQQTVSKTVRDLERELGVDLLERTSREVRLTAAGRALLQPGKDTLAQADSAFAAAREVGTGRAGLIRVGVTPAIGPDTRGDVVRALRTGSDRSVTLRDLRPSRMDVHVPRRPPAGRGRERILGGLRRRAPADGEPRGDALTDLLVERFAAAGATVTPVEGHVTVGGQLLTELVEAGAIAAMPAGTPPPSDVRRLEVLGFTMPLLVVWPAGRPQAVTELRAQLGA